MTVPYGDLSHTVRFRDLRHFAPYRSYVQNIIFIFFFIFLSSHAYRFISLQCFSLISRFKSLVNFYNNFQTSWQPQ